MLKMSKGFKVPGGDEEPSSKSSTIINVYSDSKKSFYDTPNKNDNVKTICAWIATAVGFILSIVSIMKLLTLNKYIYMAYTSENDWESMRMLSERDSVKAVAIICLIIGLIAFIAGLAMLIIKYIRKTK